MSAIEQGLFTPTTRDRLLELELQKDNLNSRLAVAKSRAADLPTRDEIVAALDYYANGDLSDPLYQEALIDTFLVRAYVHSDHYDIYFSPDAKTKTEFPIGFTDATKPTFALLNGSHSLPEGPPNEKPRPKGGIFHLLEPKRGDLNLFNQAASGSLDAPGWTGASP